MKPSALLSPRAFAAGGIAALPGRQIKGPGDGMSDSIPASIDGTDPAALASGEFVIPADVVSFLGNGDNDAGAKVLEAMVAKIRQAKTGRASQPPQIDPAQFMPRGV
jgi:hypothetical protein